MDEKVILLVEDRPEDVILTLRALEKGNILNTVVVAKDGAEALDYLFGTGEYEGRDTRIQPQLVLLDLKLPKVDGHEVLRRIRSDDLTKHLPVVVFTTSNEEKDIEESYQNGSNSYICKPVDSVKFSEAVNQLRLYWLVLNEPPGQARR